MNGYECVRWDSPDLPEPSFAKYLEGNASMHKNYCRQPTGLHDIPWCFVVSTDLEWEYCNIPFCSHGTLTINIESLKLLEFFFFCKLLHFKVFQILIIKKILFEKIILKFTCNLVNYF